MRGTTSRSRLAPMRYGCNAMRPRSARPAGPATANRMRSTKSLGIPACLARNLKAFWLGRRLVGGRGAAGRTVGYRGNACPRTGPIPRARLAPRCGPSTPKVPSSGEHRPKQPSYSNRAGLWSARRVRRRASTDLQSVWGCHSVLPLVAGMRCELG